MHKDRSDPRRLFDLDSDVSEGELEEEIAMQQKNSAITKEETLYEENMQKYISYLNQFANKAEEAQTVTSCDGVTYVNHPLIQITQINYEKNIGFFDILNMETEQNKKNNFVKVMTVFTFLDNEVNKIVEILQSDLYDSLLMYGEHSTKESSIEYGEIMTARVFSLYKKIFYLVGKLLSYIENIVVQLHSIINKKQKFWKTHFKGLNMEFPLNLLGRALRTIYVIDCIVMNNPNIEEHWQLYKRMIKLAKKEPQKYDTTPYKLKKMEKMMGKIENTILSKKCMITAMEINFDTTIEYNKLPISNIKSNKELKQYIETYLESTLRSIDDNIGNVISSSDEEKRLLDLLCVYALYRRLYPSDEYKDFWKRVWGFQKKVPIIEAHSFVCVYISHFLSTVCPISKRPSGLDPKDQNSFLQHYIEKLDSKIASDFVADYTQFCVWLSRMESFVTSNQSIKSLKTDNIKGVQERLSNRIYILCEGINLIYRLNKLIYLCFILHINEQKPMNKNLLGSLILGMESLKATAYMIKKKSESFDASILTKTIARDMIILLKPIYEQLRAERRQEYFEKREAVGLILRLLQTPMSELKITIIKYSLNFLDNRSVMKSEQHSHLIKLLNKLQVVAYHQILVQKYQSCGFLYYCKDVLPIIFEWKRQNPNTCKRLQFLFDSFEDSAYLLKKCQHLTNNNEVFEDYRKYILAQFEEHYMLPLKRKVEDFLRISVHFMLIEKLQGMNPYREEMSDLMKLIQFQKIRIFDTVIDLQIQITKAFNETFYNMNTINIYDMQTYEQMRVMANYLFGLNLHDVYLPSQTITQGTFDIFNIIRNIPGFISSYKYNLLSQRFLEVTTDTKMITTIGIEQISDSIRTHGKGIVATIVNAFYRFLAQKMQSFNKFLYNDLIRSALVRERKWFKNQQEKQGGHDGYYPYERAKKFYDDIKKIGKFEDQSNYIDQMREIITSVGNSLGFIRLIRSSNLNSSSKSIQFLPTKVQLIESLDEIAEKAQLSETTKLSCKQLDDILKSFEENFTDKVDFLNLMIGKFSKMVTRQNDHLQNFYMLIPILSINYAEEMARGKEQINKKFSHKAFIYDDGLVMGVAYFLCLLRQNIHYKTLHWPQSTANYFEEAKAYSKEITQTKGHSAKFREDLNMQNQLLLKKLELMEQEFNFFNYNLISCNVLFKNQIPSAKDPASPPTNPTQKQ